MKLSLVAIALVFLSAGLPQAEKQRIVYAKYIEPPYYPPLPVRPKAPRSLRYVRRWKILLPAPAAWKI